MRRAGPPHVLTEVDVDIEQVAPADVEAYLQAGLDALNEAVPPRYWPIPFQSNFRHNCTEARQAKHTGKGVSTAIDLKERYVTSWRHDDSTGLDLPVENEDGAEYAILFREGTCKSCREVARSRVGRVVRTADRPPVHGRVGRN